MLKLFWTSEKQYKELAYWSISSDWDEDFNLVVYWGA
jgi:hypothetical protein